MKSMINMAVYNGRLRAVVKVTKAMRCSEYGADYYLTVLI